MRRGAADLAQPRLTADEKLMAKSQKLLDKMIDAQSRQDTAAARVISDSTLALVDPSCVVKQPERPSDYYDAQRAINERAEQATLKAADFSSGRELAMPATVLSRFSPTRRLTHRASEKSAVSAKDAELKSLLGIRSAQEARVSKQGKAGAARDTVTPAPAPAPAAPTVPSGAVAVNQCMMKNVRGTSGRDRGPRQPR